MTGILQVDSAGDDHDAMMERMEIAAAARRHLGLPAVRAIAKIRHITEMAPRFTQMAIAVRAAIRGMKDPTVIDMAMRNMAIVNERNVSRVSA